MLMKEGTMEVVQGGIFCTPSYTKQAQPLPRGERGLGQVDLKTQVHQHCQCCPDVGSYPVPEEDVTTFVRFMKALRTSERLKGSLMN